jgi:NOL1/NOP2/sun family putative RNA methylase
MQSQLGVEYPAFEAIFTQPPTHGLRVNTLKLTPSQFEAISPFPLSPLSWSPAGFLVADEIHPGKHPYHAAGLYYLQDPHAQAVVEILAPQPGEKVLDLAAAPGGKTTHLASRMQNQGLLVANEIKTKRIGHLAANLERWGAHNVTVINETPERLAEFFGPFFDRVLVDAPCSGEGMFRKDRAAILGWSEDAILGCAVRQNAILNYSARLVRPGGRLCYSTCTFAPEENETVIYQFLENHPEYLLIPPPDDCCSGIENTSTGMIHLWPHHSPGEGHFIALLQRTEDASSARRTAEPGYEPTSLPHSLRSLWETWSVENFTHPGDISPILVGSRLYALPAGLPKLRGLRVLHPGWWLGNLKKDRFEPSHALAMGLRTVDVQHRLALPADSSEILKYLRGETLQSDGKDGWTLVSVDSISSLSPGGEAMGDSSSSTRTFPLGWGKRVQGTLKNHYPRGLVWR